MILPPTNNPRFQEAIETVRQADTLFVLAGAGLSTAVGVATYWSEEGSYGDETTKYGHTALEHADASLWRQDVASQIAYFTDKREQFAAIDFPASIYGTLLGKVEGKDYFCVTSNVDSGFYRAGFDGARLFEVHGSYRVCQCIKDGLHGIFPASVAGTLACPVCGSPTRPNALFFNDFEFNPKILYAQQYRFNEFWDEVPEQSRVVILELGVGVTVPKVRQVGNNLYRDFMTDYIHVNLEPEPEFLFGQFCPFENRESWVQAGVTEFIEAL